MMPVTLQWRLLATAVAALLLCVVLLASRSAEETEVLLFGPKTLKSHPSSVSTQELAAQMKRTAGIMRKEEKLRDFVMQAQRRFRSDMLKDETSRRDRFLACSSAGCKKREERSAQDLQRQASNEARRIWKETESNAAKWRK